MERKFFLSSITKMSCFLVVLTLMLSCNKEELTITGDVQGKDDVVVDDDIVTFTIKGVTFKMVKVEGGTFRMGSESGYYNEKPVHSVTLSDYYIGETEVTQALWMAVMGRNPSNWKGDNLPVEQVSWDDCQEFIIKLNQLSGKTFSLPTEAQWEFAARGGNKSRGYEYSGSNSVGDVAWYYDNSSSKTHQVGTKQANELGLYDMSGNVYEWCQDWHDLYSSSSQTDPTGPSSGSYRVNRGGGWFNDASRCRSAYRDYGTPGSTNSFLGLRLVLLDLQTGATVTIQSDKAVLNVNGIVANLVKVDGGTFQMGSESGESNEKPVHSVTLSGYYIGETEVTQALWKAVMGSNPSNWKGDNLPVEQVSWYDCQEFISKLNQLTGKRFALPTEAQWEFATRGGNKSRGYEYSGSNSVGDVAWYEGNSSDMTHQVGTKQANELGLYDMSGNVWEWCQDWYGSYSSSSQTDPTGPSSGSYRVSRGGSWYYHASYCRSTYRYDNIPDRTNSFLGLRLVLFF